MTLLAKEGRPSLLVEGTSDAHFWLHALEKLRELGKYGGPRLQPAGRHASTDVGAIRVEPAEGWNGALKSFVDKIKDGSPCVGLLVDADTSAPKRWRQVRRELKKGWSDSYGHFPFPDRLPPEGFVVDRADARLGVYVVPDNESAGALEDVVAKCIGDDDAGRRFAGEVCAEAAERSSTWPGRWFKETHAAKARLHTWLAWHEKPGMPLGKAVQMGYIAPNAPAIIRFAGWCERLFPPAR